MFVSNKKSYILKKEYEETKMIFLFIEYSSLFYNKWNINISYCTNFNWVLIFIDKYSL